MIKFSKRFIPYCHWEYLNEVNGDRLRIVPERGGLITEWRCKGREVLYFDEKRFSHKDKSVRGGIPVLFPICGDLPGNCLSTPHGNFHLPQHGFARDRDWKLKLLDDQLGIGLQLKDSEFTRTSFPYFFLLEIEARLKKEKLEIKIFIHNNSDVPMPFGFGLHPYFNVSDLNRIELTGLSPTCINQLNMLQESTIDNLKKLQEGVDFLVYGSNSVRINDLLNGNSVSMDLSHPMDLTVVWTDPPRQMICVEPWTSPRKSLITGERKFVIEPGCNIHLKTCINFSHYI